MRLYDFRCGGCGHVFEELVEPGEAVICPSCAAPGATRQLSAFSIGRGGEGGGSHREPAPAWSGGGCSTGMCGI